MKIDTFGEVIEIDDFKTDFISSEIDDIELSGRFEDMRDIEDVHSDIDDLICRLDTLKDGAREYVNSFGLEVERLITSRDNYACIWIRDDALWDEDGVLREVISDKDDLELDEDIYFKEAEGRLFPEGRRLMCGDVDGLSKSMDALTDFVEDLDSDENSLYELFDYFRVPDGLRDARTEVEYMMNK